MTQNNVKIAITGGIGSGKSTVAEIIAKQGYKVISCDAIYSRLLSDKEFVNVLSAEFGDILTEEGTLDRKRLSTVVFSDKAKLAKLNEITHPAIMERALKEMSGEGIYFCEVPLFFENNFEKLFDGVIVILRDKSIRISAVTERDDKTESEVVSRINNQFDYDNSKFEEYYVIHNNRNLKNLQSETLKIIEKIKKEYPI
mgnify:CR=1 FL=1